MKQTAVEWLEEFLNSHCNPSVCNVEYSDFKLAIQQAKEMEKEQIINANWEASEDTDRAEQYYNETFKSE
jgi:hypothetical protein